LADLGLDRPVGTDGSKTELLTFAPPPVRGKGRTIEASDGVAGAQAIFDFLREKKFV
jgi:electron transfer flavoprotein alpha/beta subunit